MYNTFSGLGSLAGKKKRKKAAKTPATALPMLTMPSVAEADSSPFALKIGGIKFPLIAVLGILIIAGVLLQRKE